MAYSLRYRFQKREYIRLSNTNFFPGSWNPDEHELCIGTKSRNLGDALLLTPLFVKLREAYPELKLSGFIRAFNPVVLENLPVSASIRRGPKTLWGDDTNLGCGHFIEQKLNWFGLPYTEDDIKPVIILSEAEKLEADETLKTLFGSDDRPLWVIHPWGKTWSSLLSKEVWDQWCQAIAPHGRILQIGLSHEVRIQNARFFEIDASTHASARKLFAILARAQRFVGIDSGPMHVARAFSIRSLICIHTKTAGTLDEGMRLRSQLPYFHPTVRHFSNLYAFNHHLETADPHLVLKGLEWIALK